ncbi:MAG: 3-oxoadipate enol-lactonase [Betaproteobacteria bacterium]|nr:3-oxoadipate enol-lactonase [Betaproteobacteria bacterium]
MKIRTNGIEINYSVEGSGPWVVMSHSVACNLRMWDPQAALLAKSCTVLRYDTRGHGESSAPEGEYTLEALADDLKGMLDGLGVKTCRFIGLSMGGMIGQTFALRYPGVFSAMVLADTCGRYSSDVWPMWEARIKTAREKGMEPLVEPTLSRWFTEPFRASRRDATDRIAAMIRSTPVPGFVGCCYAIPRINLTHRLKEVACPTLVVLGDQDQATPLEAAREIQAAIPGSQLVTIPQAAHLSNVEQPEAFNAALTSFFAKLP